MKAALYYRVSTEEQGKSGYSLRQQIEALRRYCDAHDLEVVGEFEDRASGASLDRLGLDALRDAVSAGCVDAVLAQDRDRYSREPAHVYILREEWTAIPVPDSGIPPETVARARSNIAGNTRNPSRNSDRIWELSGGTGVCGYCGSRLGTHTSFNGGKTRYFYYVCPMRGTNRANNGTCPHTKHHRAEVLELLVRDTLADTFREESSIDFVNHTCDQCVEVLRKAHRSDPAKTRERMGKQIDVLGTKLARMKDLYVDGDVSKEEYRERRALLEEDVARVTDERSRLDDIDGEMERIEHLRAALLSVEKPFSGHYCFTGYRVGLDNDMMERTA